MEKCLLDSSLLQLVDLNLLGNQSENGNVVWLVVIHAHRICLLVLLGCLSFLIFVNVQLLLSLCVLSLLAIPHHLLTDFDQIKRLLHHFIVILQ